MAPKFQNHERERRDEPHETKDASSSVSSSSSNKILVLGCIMYFTYCISISVDSQFLSLYYKSKGFGGTLRGVLYSITPLTTFLTIPIWGMLTRAGDKDSKNDKATTRPFQILCMTLILATMGQVSLAFLDQPIYMMIVITVAGIFQSPAKPMLDGILIDHLDDKSNFGRVRFFSILGSGFGTNLGGRLLALAQKSTEHGNEISGTDNLWTGFNILFLARLVLTVPPLICILQLQNVATKKVKNSTTSASKITTKSSPKTLNDKLTKDGKKESISVLSVAQDVGKHCFGERNHLLFFLCIFIAGFSGGVSDVFSCKLKSRHTFANLCENSDQTSMLNLSLLLSL